MSAGYGSDITRTYGWGRTFEGIGRCAVGALPVAPESVEVAAQVLDLRLGAQVGHVALEEGLLATL